MRENFSRTFLIYLLLNCSTFNNISSSILFILDHNNSLILSIVSESTKMNGQESVRVILINKLIINDNNEIQTGKLVLKNIDSTEDEFHLVCFVQFWKDVIGNYNEKPEYRLDVHFTKKEGWMLYQLENNPTKYSLDLEKSLFQWETALKDDHQTKQECKAEISITLKIVS